MESLIFFPVLKITTKSAETNVKVNNCWLQWTGPATRLHMYRNSNYGQSINSTKGHGLKSSILFKYITRKVIFRLHGKGFVIEIRIFQDSRKKNILALYILLLNIHTTDKVVSARWQAEVFRRFPPKSASTGLESIEETHSLTTLHLAAVTNSRRSTLPKWTEG